MHFVKRMLVWLLAILILPTLAVAETLPRSVLVLDGSEPNSPWGLEFRAVLRTAFSTDAKLPVAVYSEVLDLARFNFEEYETLLRSYLRAKYRDKPIGVIVVHGPQALEIFMQLRAELWSAVPVVFGNVDESTVNRMNLPPDVTGTILPLRLNNMVAAARALVPDLRTIALVGDPFERQPFRRHFTQELSQFANEFEFINLMGEPLSEVKERVASLPRNAAIVFVPFYVDRTGSTYISRDALGQIAGAANRPVFSDVETHIGYGSTGGFMAVPKPVAQAAARLTLRILDGENAAEIPITVGNFTKPIFDWRQLQRFGISVSTLPPGSEVRFRTQSMWEQYRWQLNAIFAALLLQATMIAWLLLERRRRQFAQLESQGRLREVIHLDRVAAVGAMSASIAHELNQPLGAILANAETAKMLLAANPVDQDQLNEIITDIVQSDQRAVAVIAHMRGLLKKQGESELQEFDLNGALRDALHTLEPEARKRRVQISTHQVQGTLPVRADQVHLEQVILNLATNAMDAMQDCAPGERKLIVQTALTGNSEVEVSVSDSGTGIPHDKLTSIFDTFYTTKKQGTGLGLSIVRTIVENCGGQIWAENRPGGGAVFRFTLPLTKAYSA